MVNTMSKLVEFNPLRINKKNAERILHAKIDVHTWTVFNEFVTRTCKPEDIFLKYWKFWHEAA